VQEATQSAMKKCAICEQPILPEHLPCAQLENGEEAHLVCWKKNQSAPQTEPLTHEKQVAWEKLCEEKGWSCRICGALPDLGQQFENNLCEDCKLSLGNYDPTVS